MWVPCIEAGQEHIIFDVIVPVLPSPLLVTNPTDTILEHSVVPERVQDVVTGR